MASSPSLPPGPRGLWFLGSALDHMRDPLGNLVRGHERFGEVVHFNMGPGGTVILLSHPDHVKHVLVSNPQNYVKPSPPRPSPLLGEGLFSSRGDLWKRQRRMMQPAFHRERFGCLVDRTLEGTRSLLSRLEGYQRSAVAFDLEQEMTWGLRSILGHNIFSTDITELSAELREAFACVMAFRSKKISFRALLPRLGQRRLQRSHELLDEAVYSILRQRLAQPGGQEDLLAAMIPARDLQGEPMTEKQLRDEAMTLLIAGHEATVSALTWVWYLLEQHPEVARKAREELATVLGDAVPTAQAIARLHYCRQVFQETLRLYPPAWVIGRVAQQEDRIGGYTIPAGATVTCSPYVMHRHPAYWEQPERFLPERFAPERKGAQTRYTYFPFGGGQRMCIGDSLAEVHVLTVMATLLPRYRFQLEPGFPVEIEVGSTLRPAHGLRVRALPARLEAPLPRVVGA